MPASLDPDEMDFAEVMDVAVPYLWDRVGVYSDWTPLQHRGTLCSKAVDAEDPWPFRNILVT
jgi:homospermidine synthase